MCVKYWKGNPRALSQAVRVSIPGPGPLCAQILAGFPCRIEASWRFTLYVSHSYFHKGFPRTKGPLFLSSSAAQQRWLTPFHKAGADCSVRPGATLPLLLPRYVDFFSEAEGQFPGFQEDVEGATAGSSGGV